MMRTTIALAAAALLTSPASARLQERPEGQQQGAGRLVGIYKLVAGKNGTEEIPRDQLGGRVTITPEQITAFDPEDNEVYVIAYAFEGRGQGQAGQDQAQTKGRREGMGRRITMTTVRSSRGDAVGSTARGLLRVQEGRLQLIYDYGEDADFPEDFEPKDDRQNLMVLERVDDADDPARPSAGAGERPNP